MNIKTQKHEDPHWLVSDRSYFKRRPHRRYRLRPFYKDEFPLTPDAKLKDVTDPVDQMKGVMNINGADARFKQTAANAMLETGGDTVAATVVMQLADGARARMPLLVHRSIFDRRNQVSDAIIEVILPSGVVN